MSQIESVDGARALGVAAVEATLAVRPESAAPAIAPAAAAPTAVFLDAARRFKLVKLEWPFNFKGRDYAAIEIRRLTAGEVAAFQST